MIRLSRFKLQKYSKLEDYPDDPNRRQYRDFDHLRKLKIEERRRLMGHIKDRKYDRY